MDKPVPLDVLAIAAHPDDSEITCGGMLLKMAGMGRKTGIIDLTRGEMGTYGTQEDRDNEAKHAGEILGLSYRGNLNLPDAKVENSNENKLKLAEQIRLTRPELVVLPHWEQRHPDHLACTRLGYDACFIAGLKKAEIDGEPFRPRKIIYANYSRSADYSFLVDISDVFDKKCEAVAAYKSQFANPVQARRIFQPGVDIYEYMKTKAAYFGLLAAVQYAEAFVIKESILIDDPQNMPVASI